MCDNTDHCDKHHRWWNCLLGVHFSKDDVVDSWRGERTRDSPCEFCPPSDSGPFQGFNGAYHFCHPLVNMTNLSRLVDKIVVNEQALINLGETNKRTKSILYWVVPLIQKDDPGRREYRGGYRYRGT